MKKFLTLFTALFLMGSMMVVQAATDTYTVAGGNTDLFGSEWTPADANNDMTLVGGLYTWSKENVTLSDNVEFKVCLNHGWGTAWPAQNYVLNIPQTAVYTVSITFNASSKEVNATATKTGDAGPVSATYTVAGNDISIWGTSWDSANEANDMVLDGDVYKWEKQVVKTGTSVLFKVCKNHGWGNAWPSDNYEFVFPKWGEFIFTITFNPDTKEVAASYVEKSYTVVGDNAILFDGIWNPENGANDMTLLGDSITYVKTYSNVELEAGDILYKVAADHDWDKPGQYPTGEGSQTLNISKAGNYDITFTYVPSTESLEAEATLIPDTWTVAGDNATLFGEAWNTATTANEMTLVEENYTWSKENVTLGAGTVLFKVCKNHAWTEAYPSDNYQLAIDEDGIYDVTITFNETSKDVNATATKKGDAVVVPTIAMHGNFLGGWANTENFVIADGNETASLKLNITSTGTKNFGMRIGGSGNWTSNGSEFKRTDPSHEIVSGNGDCSLDVDVAGEYIFTWTYASNTLEVSYPDVYTVVGNSTALFGGEWSLENAANDMVLQEDDITYVKTYSKVELAEGDIMYKVAVNRAWDQPGQYPTGEGSQTLNISKAGKYDVTFTYVPSAESLEAEATLILDIYTVVGGSAELFGTAWNETLSANDMVLQSDGITYVKTYSNVTLSAGDIAYKVAKNHEWNSGQYPAYGDADMVLNIPADGTYNVTITFVSSTPELTAVATLVDPTPSEDWVEVRSGLTQDRYYTLCYDKKMTAIQGASLWSFAGKDANMAYLVEAEAPYAAGMPYLIYAESDKLEAVVETVDNPTATHHNGLYGTLSYMDASALAAAGATHMLKDNAIRPIGNDNHLDANRAYIKVDEIGAVATAPGRRVRAISMQENVATGIEGLEATEAPVKLIMNGKMYILRGEKMYDATGRMVK